MEVVRSEPGARLDLVASLPDGRPVSCSLALEGAREQEGRALAVLHAMASIQAVLDCVSPLHVGQDGAAVKEVGRRAGGLWWAGGGRAKEVCGLGKRSRKRL